MCAMAYKYRDEIVGKRFLSVCSSGKLKFAKISDWAWRAGIVRAASHKDPKHPELTVLVEFDDSDWKNREWIRVYQDDIFTLFLVENTLVWALRKESAVTGAAKNLHWPSLTFKFLVDKAGLGEYRLKPVEYFVDKQLGFTDYTDVRNYQDQDGDSHPASRDYSEVRKAIKQWTELQDGQRILVTTPSVLVGYRVEVYRAEGTTQWYTAVIVSYNDSTRELTLTDDTVLEEHNEDPCLVQMRLIGDGVVESILKGENIGITPRRRTCSNQQNNPVHYSTRTRSHHPTSSSHSYLSTSRLTPTAIGRKSRNRAVTVQDDVESNSSQFSSAATSVPDKGSSQVPHHSQQLQQDNSSRSNERRKKSGESGDAASVSGHRRHLGSSESKKRTSRQRRITPSKDVEDTDSAEEEECSSQRSRLTETNELVTKQQRDTQQTHVGLSNHGDSRVLQEENEATAKFQPAIKSPKGLNCKEGSKTSTPGQQNLISGHRLTPPSETDRTLSAPSAIDDACTRDRSVPSSRSNESKSDHTSPLIYKSLSISAAVSSVSVVLTPLSPSVVSAVVNSKTCSVSDVSLAAKDTSVSENDKSCKKSIISANEVLSNPSQPQQKEKSPSEPPCPLSEEVSDKSVVLLQQTSAEESCQRNSVVSCPTALPLTETIKTCVVEPNRTCADSELSVTKESNVAIVSVTKDNISDSKECKNSAISATDECSSVVQKRVEECDKSTVSKLEFSSAVSEKEIIRKSVSNKQLCSSVGEGKKCIVETQIKSECDTVISVKQELNDSVVKVKSKCSDVNNIASNRSQSDHKSNSRSIIVSAGRRDYHNCKSVLVSVGQNRDVTSLNTIPKTGHDASSITKSGDLLPISYISGMSQLDKNERSSAEKSSSSSQASTGSSGSSRHHQTTTTDCRTSSPRTSAESGSSSTKELGPRSKSDDKKHSNNLHLDRHEPVRVYRDPHLVNSSQGVRHVDCLHHSLMHPAGISHSAAAAAAAAVYPRVATLPQHNRAPLPPSPLGPYGLSSHLLPPPHVPAATAAATGSAPPGSHIDQHAAAMHSQAYRHILSQHPLLPPQYGNAAGPHVGIDIMWQQKYNPNPWVMAQYEEMRLERAMAQAQERERNRLERDRREDIDRMEREKAEREKAEKERQERERLQKERQQDRERLDREERERAQREAVQQHFEESLRLALQKQQQQQKTMGWSPMSSLPMGKTQPGIGRSSPTVSLPQGAHSQSLHPSDHEREKVRDKEKERMSAMDARMRHEHERWVAVVQQQRNEQVAVLPPSHPQNFSSVEPRTGGGQPKQEMYSMARSSPHAATTVGHPSNKSGVAPSPAVSTPSNVPSSQHKSETSFSLYGYQPFQHTYITHAQLKAREETKGPSNMQPIIVSGSKQSNAGPTVKQEKDIPYDRPPTPGSSRTSMPISQGASAKHQLKLMQQGQERSSPMYQPLVGGGGAFKPYEYSNNSPAPPAHQSTSSPTMGGRMGTPHFHHPQQDQPQNLVKGDIKGCHDQSVLPPQNHQRYDSRDSRQPVSTPPCSIPASYTPPYSTSKSASPAANASYSYSLIQQGLVPNPLYIAATHSGASTTINTSATATASSQAPPKSSSSQTGSPISQQYPRATSGSGITSGTPVCRSSSVPYSGPPMRSSHSYSPVGPATNQAINVNPNRTSGPQEAHVSSRAHITVQGSSHRSPSPAHVYGTSPSSTMQSATPNSPLHSRGPTCSSPRISTTPNSQVQGVHRMPMYPAANNISPPNPTPASENQVQPLNLQGGGSMVKRKSTKDANNKKRQKTNEEHLLPPQLHPQVHPASSPPVRQMGTPPHLVSNTLVQTGPHITASGHVLPTPSTPECSMPTSNRLEAATTPPMVMPDLLSTTTTASTTGPNLTPGFIDSYRSFVTTAQDYQPYIGKHSKGQNKSLLDSPNCTDVVEPPARPTSNASSSASNLQLTPAVSVGSQEGNEESRMTVSPALSASSALTSSSSTGGSTNHTKLKKAWLQRHSENEDKKVPIDNVKVDSPVKPPAIETSADPDFKTVVSTVASPQSSTTPPVNMREIKLKSGTSDASSINGLENKAVKAEGQVEDDSTSSASEMEQEVKHVKRKTRISRKQGPSVPNSGTSKRQKITINPNEAAVEETQSAKKEKDGSRKKSTPSEKESSSSRRRGRKTKGRNVASDDAQKKKSPKPPEKPSLAQLKKTGESFLQDGPCCEVAPRLPKCRECRMTPHQRSKKMPNIFCRFYAYRKLRYGKNGTILGAGFSEPSDATEDDLKLWLPPIDSPPSDIEVETSKFLLTHVGDQFCDLVEMERDAQTMHISDNTTITWKRVVQGVREMCDVCETTLFNIHWVCHKCGFVVCIDCYKARKSGLTKGEDSPSKDRDEYQWLLCSNRQAHEQEKLMLTQIIASTALWDVGKTLHEVRRKWNIPTYCNCNTKDGDQEGKHSTNGICKLMSAVTKCFSSEKDNLQVNGLSESPRLTRKSGKGSSVNGVIKQEDGISGYSSESGGSPLSWLADVALNSSGKLKDDRKKKVKLEDEEEEKDKLSDRHLDSTDGFGESDDDKSENFSTLRELLIRPTGKMGGKNSGTNSSAQKTLTSTLDEVISCVIEQRVRKSDKKCKEKQLLHFTRRHQMLRSGRELLPIRSCMLTESSLLYPEIPHVWLGSGKILLLKDPNHTGNMQMFQEQWKRGQPVIVADVGKKLDVNLWNPEGFLRDFGDVKNDFLNCQCGTLVQNQPMRKFWEGFDNISKRMKDEDGEYMVLKLKDWPPSEEFSELLPARYQDLMKVLPLPHYTHRDGMFNMASRLPECFVRPDLGPRMYNAYGLVSSCNKGSTNLHLDISDAVNVLAYVGTSLDCKEDDSSGMMSALDESGCDSLMKKRAKEKSAKIGAIWHIYNARDADKIRDLLNKVAEEQGAKRDPHHDPIHNQEWYLDEELRNRLFKEYGVEGYVIVQCFGDAIFIPAGSPHQVRNLSSCVKVSEDFVSPESIGHSFFLTQEIRNLSDSPTNHEDKLQIKNIIYHAVKDALALLQSCDPEDSKT